MGKAWCEDTGLPLPVGLNLVSKALGIELARNIATTCQHSRLWGFHNSDEVYAFANHFGRGLAKDHVEMLKFEDFLCLPEDVRKAMQIMFEIGDFGKLTIKGCDCLFGQLGMNVHISEVRSYDKLTGEGMTLLGSELNEIVGEAIENADGGPDDYQFWETQDSSGLNKLVIAISPEIQNLNEKEFIDTILKKLKIRDIAGSIASQIWGQAGTLQVVRANPRMTIGHKMLPIIKTPEQPNFTY
jgi:hypothetical protein